MNHVFEKFKIKWEKVERDVVEVHKKGYLAAKRRKPYFSWVTDEWRFLQKWQECKKTRFIVLYQKFGNLTLGFFSNLTFIYSYNYISKKNWISCFIWDERFWYYIHFHLSCVLLYHDAINTSFFTSWCNLLGEMKVIKKVIKWINSKHTQYGCVVRSNKKKCTLDKLRLHKRHIHCRR